MTGRAISGLPIDWQILLYSPADEEMVRTALHKSDPQAGMETIEYADVPGLVAKTGETTQITGEAAVLGLDAAYKKTFPTEIVWMAGSDEGVLAAQQTAANLHVSIGDKVTIQRPGGLPPADVKIDGIISLPDAGSLFQKIGVAPTPGIQAPPDNVLLLPADLWHHLFLEPTGAEPRAMRSELHVHTSRTNVPGAPEDAYRWELQRVNHFEASIAGRGVVADNLASKLAGVRADALYARVLFLFLGLPGLVAAALLTLGIAGSGSVRRRRQQALLRTRGATISVILKLASAEAVTVAIGGAILGAIIAFAVSGLFRIFLGFSLTGVFGWLLSASGAGLLLSLIAVLRPAWRDARQSTVAAAKGFSLAKGKPLWRRVWLDVILLTIAAIELWWMASTGYELILAPEGATSVSVHYEAFAGPFCLWIGTMLVTLRIFGLMLARGLLLAVKLRLPPFVGRLARIVAASLSRQRTAISQAMVLVALTVSFAVSTAIFNATYQTQSRVDAELTNGSDVTVAGIPSARVASELLSKLKTFPTVVGARVMQHGYAYVGNDLQDIYGIDPSNIGDATQMADAYFANGNAAATLKTLVDQPDGVLVSDETVTDFQLQAGDQLNLRLQRTGTNDIVPFRFVGVVREFPTAPKDSFIVANSDYLVSHVQSPLEWVILIRTNGDPSALGRDVSRLASAVQGVKVNDIVSAKRQIASTLSGVDLRGLTILELSFAVVFVVASTGLALFLSLSERRRSFSILSALGAKPQHLAAFMWSEAWTILVGGGLVGICLGWVVALALVKVLAGVFDPPPEALTVPWAYLSLLCICAIVLTAGGVALLLRKLQREPIISDLRSWV
jgi:putative ABC transport system permease protein